MQRVFEISAQLIKIHDLVDDKKYFEIIRKLRWPYEVRCPHCTSNKITKRGKKKTQPHCQKYRCKNCGYCFDDLSDTVLSGHHQPLRVWILCLYLMGLNLSNQQIAQELDLNKDDCQKMTTALRNGINEKKSKVHLEGEVECDEVYVIAGHKGYPEAV